MSKLSDKVAYDGFLPVLPVVGTAIAIVFDVGYFYGVGINYFTLFSLTEHISFAFEALPVAVLILMLAVFIDALTEKIRFKSRVERVQNEGNRSIEQIVARIQELGTELKVIDRRLFWIRLAY